MALNACSKCGSEQISKAGIIKDRQRYRCKACNYYFTVAKTGKKIDDYYVTKALQLYIEGISYREIERLLGVSHVSVMNWVRQYKIKPPTHTAYHPTYKILSFSEVQTYFSKKENMEGAGVILTELGDKFMLIKWERFKKE